MTKLQALQSFQMLQSAGITKVQLLQKCGYYKSANIIKSGKYGYIWRGSTIGYLIPDIPMFFF